ncbi:unnamed protein product, partial [marine sediment metagenome]
MKCLKEGIKNANLGSPGWPESIDKFPYNASTYKRDGHRHEDDGFNNNL